MSRKRVCALLCASLSLCSGNIKAVGDTKNVQDCSASNSSNVKLGEFVSEELKRTEIEGNKESQFGAETFFGNGALSSKRKEAIRAKGAQSVLDNEKVLKAFYKQNSNELRERSKSKQNLSTALYALSWPIMLLPWVSPVYDGVKGIRMQLIYNKFCNEFNKLEKIKINGKDSKLVEITKFQEFLGQLDERHYYYWDGKEKFSEGYCSMVWGNLLAIALGMNTAGKKKGEDLTWKQYKAEVEKQSHDWKAKFIDPVDEWVHLLHSFRTGERKPDLVAEAVVLKDLAYIVFGGLTSTALNSVLNNLSQRIHGQSKELNILANKVDELKKLERDKMSFAERCFSLGSQAKNSSNELNVLARGVNKLKKIKRDKLSFTRRNPHREITNKELKNR